MTVYCVFKEREYELQKSYLTLKNNKKIDF